MNTFNTELETLLATAPKSFFDKYSTLISTSEEEIAHKVLYWEEDKVPADAAFVVVSDEEDKNSTYIETISVYEYRGVSVKFRELSKTSYFESEGECVEYTKVEESECFVNNKFFSRESNKLEEA